MNHFFFGNRRFFSPLRIAIGVATLGWLGCFGVLLGQLIATSPEADWAPLAFLFLGPFAWSLGQASCGGGMVLAWSRGFLGTFVFSGAMAWAGGSRLMVLTPIILLSYAVLMGCLGMVTVGAIRFIGGIGREKMGPLSPTLLIADMVAGFLLCVVAGLFLWRAHAERPEFDGFTPSAYSRSMDCWGWALCGAAVVFGLAWLILSSRYQRRARVDG